MVGGREGLEGKNRHCDDHYHIVTIVVFSPFHFESH
jgi:hypothetical protein